MILDERTEFADATVLPTAQGRAIVGDTIDLSTPRNIGSPGNVPLYLVIQVVAAVTGVGASVTFELVSDAQHPVLTDGTATVHATSKTFPVAALTKDTTIAVIPIPGEPPAYERYLALIANPSGAALTAGSINAFMTPNPKQWKAYPDAS